MLIFIDESGDTGRKLGEGSTSFFVVSLLVFDDFEQANACDLRIDLLRKELGLNPKFEFHFKKNRDEIREAFLEAVSRYNFVYFSVVINKDPEKLYGEVFNHKDSFFKYACSLVFNNALPVLARSTVVLDKCGTPRFTTEIRKYLRDKVDADGRPIIKKIKQEDSERNNLLQLADYISGVVNRKVQQKKKWDKYYKYLAPREMSLEIWPR